jgi:hypothetical protein
MHAPGPERGPSRARVRVRESSRTRRDRRPLGKSYRSGPEPATKAYRENPRSTRNGGVRSRRGRGVPAAGRRVLVRPPSISGCPGDGSESPAELRVTGRIYGAHPTELPDQTGSGLDSGTVPTRFAPDPRRSRKAAKKRGQRRRRKDLTRNRSVSVSLSTSGSHRRWTPPETDHLRGFTRLLSLAPLRFRWSCPRRSGEPRSWAVSPVRRTVLDPETPFSSCSCSR